MDYKKALSKCMQICSRKEYCVSEITDKLIKWEVDQTTLDDITNTLINNKFIDHKRYTRAYVNDKFRFNKWGKIKIKYHLKNKQIEELIIDEFLNKIDSEEYDQAIKKEIIKKQKTVKGKTDFEKKQKIIRYVISKGFEPTLVFDLLNMDESLNI